MLLQVSIRLFTYDIESSSQCLKDKGSFEIIGSYGARHWSLFFFL